MSKQPDDHQTLLLSQNDRLRYVLSVFLHAWEHGLSVPKDTAEEAWILTGGLDKQRDKT